MSNHVVNWPRASFQVPTKKKNEDGSPVMQEVTVEQGGEVPDGVDEGILAILVGAGGVVAVDADAMTARRSRASANAPSESSSQHTWAQYAVTRGADEDEAAAMSKADLIARYGARSS